MCDLEYPREIQFLAVLFQLLWSLKSAFYYTVFLNYKLWSQNQRPDWSQWKRGDLSSCLWTLQSSCLYMWIMYFLHFLQISIRMFSWSCLPF